MIQDILLHLRCMLHELGLEACNKKGATKPSCSILLRRIAFHSIDIAAPIRLSARPRIHLLGADNPYVSSVKGMRTCIAGQSEPTQDQVEEGRLHNETWTWYPDDMPLRSLYGGDSRAALVIPSSRTLGPHGSSIYCSCRTFQGPGPCSVCVICVHQKPSR